MHTYFTTKVMVELFVVLQCIEKAMARQFNIIHIIPQTIMTIDPVQFAINLQTKWTPTKPIVASYYSTVTFPVFQTVYNISTLFF